MLIYLIITKLLYLLDRLPYRSKFGLSLADRLKYYYYYKVDEYKCPRRCLCGGIIATMGCRPDGWVTDCNRCGLLIDED